MDEIKVPADIALLGLAFDLETTGLNVREDEITEFGGTFIAFDKHARVHILKRSSQMRVKVQRTINAVVQELTGISNAILEREKTFEIVLEQFTQFVETACADVPREIERCLFTQNGNEFDIPILIHVMHRHGFSPATYLRRWRITNSVDMLPFCRNSSLLDNTKLMHTKEGKAIFKLGDIYKMVVGRPLVGAHGALQDAMGVCEILKASEPLRQAVLDDVQNNKYKYVLNFDRFIASRMTLLKDASNKKKTEKQFGKPIDTYFKRLKSNQTYDTMTVTSSSSSDSSSSCAIDPSICSSSSSSSSLPCDISSISSSLSFSSSDSCSSSSVSCSSIGKFT